MWTGADIVFSRRITDEFKHWCDTLTEGQACPLPDGPGGLPTGWTVLEHPFSEVINKHSNGYLTRLNEGWVLVAHDPRDRVTFVIDSKVSLLAMATNDLTPPPFTVWLVRVIGSFYDPSDPVEAAEQMLCALGGRPRVLPRALTCPEPSPRARPVHR